MSAFILRRLVLAIPVLLGILIVTFALGRSIPGDPCRAMLGEKATDAVCKPFIEKMGLNKPIPTQFALYVTNIFQGNLGDSLRYGRPVTSLLVERLPVTMELAVTALAFAIVLGIPLGI